MLQAVGIVGSLVLSMQSYWVAFMVFVSMLWHWCTPWRNCNSARLGRCRSPILWKSAILSRRCKPWGQLHYLFFPYSPVGSPSWSLFLRYDIDVHPEATTTMLCLNAASPLYYRKVLFWAHAPSHGNNCITCSFHAILSGHLHGLCFYAMTLMHALTPPQQCWLWTLHVPHTMEKHYFGRTLQAVGTSQMFMYPPWLAMLPSWPFLLLCDKSFLLKFSHHAVWTVMKEVCKEELDNLGMSGWYQKQWLTTIQTLSLPSIITEAGIGWDTGATFSTTSSWGASKLSRTYPKVANTPQQEESSAH